MVKRAPSRPLPLRTACRAGRALAFALALLAGLIAPPAPAAAGTAADADDPPAICERAVARAAKAGVPPAVLKAIALTETGRRKDGRLRPWPWAVNREGQGYWFASREAALAFARRSLAEGRRSFDLGCFQINYHWHGHNFPSLEAMADPEIGADYAARFLRALHDEFGSWSAAAGAYHSRTPELAARYRARFDTILASLGGAGFVPASAPATAPLEARGSAPTRRVRGPLIINLPRTDGHAEADDLAALPVVEVASRHARVAAPSEPGEEEVVQGR
jgi:hypothetical protein